MDKNGIETLKTIRRDAPVPRSGETSPPGPTIWEYTLGREISEARAACLRGLMRIPTGLGRLAYMAVLQQRLLEDHKELFGDWDSCSLQQKYEWLCRLLISASQRGTLPDEWLEPSTYADLIPQSTAKTSRELYEADIEAVLEILRDELAEPPNTPESGRHVEAAAAFTALGSGVSK